MWGPNTWCIFQYGFNVHTAYALRQRAISRLKKWVDWKWRTWKWRTVKIAGHEIDGPSYYYYKCKDYSDTIAKKCCSGTVQNVTSKFAVNAVQQIDSAIMSGLQKMPWIAMFSAGDKTPSTSTMFWPSKAMHSRPVQRPLEKHGHLEWLVALTARVVSMSILTWDGGVIQCQT